MNNCPYCDEDLQDMTEPDVHVEECKDIKQADFGIGDMIDFFSSGDNAMNVVIFDEKGAKQVKKK